MIDFSRVQFIKSAPSVKQRPGEALPELVFIGRSNVGKSSLINALTNQKIAKVSSKPGKTVLLNYFNVDDKFYLVDAPGYGYTASGTRHIDNFATMMEGYFSDNNQLKGVIFLLDSRHAPSKDDQTFYEFIKKQPYPILFVFTKTDKVSQKEAAAFAKSLSELGWDTTNNVTTSISSTRTIERLKGAIGTLLSH